MSRVDVYIIVEGQTEQTFVRDILAPMLGEKGVFLHAAVLGKPGHKGGGVRFGRAKNDIGKFLKQRSDTYVSTMFDYYGIAADWPGRPDIRGGDTAVQKADKMEKEMLIEIEKDSPHTNVKKRFIPYIAMHEFEALLFSDIDILAKKIDVKSAAVANILKECGEPEEINDNSQTAPSKRLQALCSKSYRKISMGKTTSEAIGIPTMRKKCPHFNEWLNKLESLAKN